MSHHGCYFIVFHIETVGIFVSIDLQNIVGVAIEIARGSFAYRRHIVDPHGFFGPGNVSSQTMADINGNRDETRRLFARMFQKETRLSKPVVSSLSLVRANTEASEKSSTSLTQSSRDRGQEKIPMPRRRNQ